MIIKKEEDKSSEMIPNGWT